MARQIDEDAESNDDNAEADGHGNADGGREAVGEGSIGLVERGANVVSHWVGCGRQETVEKGCGGVGAWQVVHEGCGGAELLGVLVIEVGSMRCNTIKKYENTYYNKKKILGQKKFQEWFLHIKSIFIQK